MSIDIRYIQFVTKKKKLLAGLVILFVFYIILLQPTFSPSLNFRYWYSLESVYCYNTDTGDILPSIDNKIIPRVKSIYFHESSCTGFLNSRQACSVESAAMMHPDWQINVLFVGPVVKKHFKKATFRVLRSYENIKFFRLHLVEYAKGTPLEDMVKDGALRRSWWQIHHMSDALRYLTLYKWGGVYLDLDVIVAKSFDNLTENWTARESDTDVAAGAMAFSRDALGRNIAADALRDFKENFRGDIWGHNGPGVITRILKKICETPVITEMSASSCKGFEVYGPELFYPVSWQNASTYFDTTELNVGQPYIYHVWNYLTQSYKVDSQSAYAKLAQRYCPITYETYEYQFGL